MIALGELGLRLTDVWGAAGDCIRRVGVTFNSAVKKVFNYQ